jgi:hypothetical protein
MEIYVWAEYLYDFFIFTVIVPVTLGVSKTKSLTAKEKWVIGFLSVLLVHEVLSIGCIELHIRNHFLYYTQTIAIALCVAGFYDGSVMSKWVVWRVALLLSLSVVLEVVLVVGFNHINSTTLTLSRLMAACCAVVSLKQLLSEDTLLSLGPNPRVYFHLGFFLFGAFTAVNTYFKSYFIENSLDLYYLFNTLSAMISAISFALFSIGFWRIKSILKTTD